MKSSRPPEGLIRYESLRNGKRANGASCLFEYAPGLELPQPSPDSLEFFLVERYRLYSRAPDSLRRGVPQGRTGTEIGSAGASSRLRIPIRSGGNQPEGRAAPY